MCSNAASHLHLQRCSNGEGSAATAADTLEWYEARRIGSEPVGTLQSWPSSEGLECERDDDDVFTVTNGDLDVWTVYPEEIEEAIGETRIY